MTMSPPNAPTLPPGTRVEVFSRYASSWAGGFEIADRLDDGYQVLRRSDRSVLPKTFRAEDLRPLRG